LQEISCLDNIKNGYETDADCHDDYLECVRRCTAGQKCNLNPDSAGFFCYNSLDRQTCRDELDDKIMALCTDQIEFDVMETWMSSQNIPKNAL
jgi:hypothetical protein